LMDPVATTALYTAMIRARESTRSDRLFDDSLAGALAGPQGDELIAWMETISPGAADNPGILIRTRFFDDALERIVGESGVDQIVILAAGLDTRAFRLSLPPGIALFEIDRPELLDLKATRLTELGTVPRCRRVAIPADLSGDWSATLCASGFDRSRPAVWLAEGLSFYLTDAQLHHLLATLSVLVAPGSWLCVDVLSRSFLISPQLAGFVAMMAANDSPLQFGTDDPESLIRAHGWRPQVTQFGEPAANFGRWAMPTADGDDPRTPHGYLIIARQ
jgi:methyltransferase (TIGR00027 family)